MTDQDTTVDLSRPKAFALRLAELFAATLSERSGEEEIIFPTRSYKLQETPVTNTTDLVPIWVRLTSGGSDFILYAQLRMTQSSIRATFHGEGSINGEQRAWSGLATEDQQGNARIVAYEPALSP